MDKTKLQLTFLDAASKKFSLTFDDPKAEIQKPEVEEAMNSIISLDIFNASNSLKDISGASLITISTTDII